MLSQPITFDRKELAACVFLLAIVCVVFGQTICHEFINFDDPSYVYENPRVPQGLTISGITWAFTHGFHSIWVPATWISLMIDWELYDIHAGGYHLTNLLLHAATAILLFVFLHRTTNRLWPSIFAAALFAVHPLRVESVAWVTERKDVLSGVFFMLAILAYVGYAKVRFSITRYLLVCALFAIGLMAKPMIVTLPCVLLLLDYWPLRRSCFADRTNAEASAATSQEGGGNPANPVRRRWIEFAWLVVEKIPLFAIAAAVSVVTILVQEPHAMASNEAISFLSRLRYVPVAYATYLGHFFYPVGLLPVYPRHATDLSPWRVIASSVLLLAITAVAFLARRRRPYVWMGWLWYLGMSVPIIGFLQIGLTAIADRFTYLPSIGLGIALTWTVADWCGERVARRRACVVGASLILAVLIVGATHLTYHWRDSETLWAYTLRQSPDNCVANTNYGDILMSEGRIKEADVYFQRALKAWPYNAITHYNVGCLLMNSGKPDEAAKHFWTAIENDHNYTAAYDHLGTLFLKRGRYDEAIAFLEKSISIESDNPGAHYELAKAVRAKGMDKEAQTLRDRAMELAPGYAESHYALGLLVASRHRTIDAIAHFERSLDAEPEWVEVRNHLIRVLIEAKRYDEAAAQCRIVLKIDPRNAEAKQLLAQIAALSK